MRRFSRRRAECHDMALLGAGLIVLIAGTCGWAETPLASNSTIIAVVESSLKFTTKPDRPVSRVSSDIIARPAIGRDRQQIAVPSRPPVVPAPSNDARLLAQKPTVQTTVVTEPAESAKGSLVEKDLHTLLTDAGFKPIRERTAPIYRIQVGASNQTFPAAVVLTPDGSLLWVVVILGSWQRPETLPAEKLLALLEANSAVGPAYFAYNSRTKIVSLARAYENRGLEPKRLKSSLDSLALIAQETKPLWDVSAIAEPKRDPAVKPAGSKVETPASKPGTPPATSNLQTQHLGNWKCRLAEKTGFELSLTKDGKYTLRIETPFGTQTHQGSYSLSNNILSLVADHGAKLEAAVEWQKADAFTFRDRSKPTESAILFRRD